MKLHCHLGHDYALAQLADESGRLYPIQHNGMNRLDFYFQISRHTYPSHIGFGQEIKKRILQDQEAGSPESPEQFIGNYLELLSSGTLITLHRHEEPSDPILLMRAPLDLVAQKIDQLREQYGEGFAAQVNEVAIGYATGWTEPMRARFAALLQRYGWQNCRWVSTERIFASSAEQASLGRPALIVHALDGKLHFGSLHPDGAWEHGDTCERWGTDARVQSLAHMVVANLLQSGATRDEAEELQRMEFIAQQQDWLALFRSQDSVQIEASLMQGNPKRMNLSNHALLAAVDNTLYSLKGRLASWTQSKQLRNALFIGDLLSYDQIREEMRGLCPSVGFMTDNEWDSACLQALSREAKPISTVSRTSASPSLAHSETGGVDLDQLAISVQIEITCGNTVNTLQFLGQDAFRLIHSTGKLDSYRDATLHAVARKWVKGAPIGFRLPNVSQAYQTSPLTHWTIAEPAPTVATPQLEGSGFCLGSAPPASTASVAQGFVQELGIRQLRPGTQIRVVGKDPQRPDSIKVLEYQGDFKFFLKSCNRPPLAAQQTITSKVDFWRCGEKLPLLAPDPTHRNALSTWTTRTIVEIQILN